MYFCKLSFGLSDVGLKKNTKNVKTLEIEKQNYNINDHLRDFQIIEDDNIDMNISINY